MKQRTTMTLTFLALLSVVALLTVAPLVSGSPARQNATEVQETVNALVQQRFQQTQQAAGPALTQAANELLTATAVAGVTQTAAFNATIDAAFSIAQTATAASVPRAVRVLLVPRDVATDTELSAAAEIVEHRMQAVGLPAVAAAQNGAILLQVLAVPNLDQYRVLIEAPGVLEFVDFTGLTGQLADFSGQVIATSAGPDRENALMHPETDAPFTTILTGDDITNASAREDVSGWVVDVVFTPDAGDDLLAFTAEHVNEPLAIAIDGNVLSIPVIQTPFGTEGGVIAGGFDQQQAEDLALQLSFGALPVALTINSIEQAASIDPALQVVIDDMFRPTPTPTFTASPSPTPDLRPTATTGQIQVAEQVFENGRMLYIQPRDQIWVMVLTDEGEGTWQIYPDTFEEGDPEVDASIVPPEGLIQPERGFGKLWRDNPEVRGVLGWAITPEFGYVSDYRYQPGGEVVNGVYTPAPGYHVLFSLYGEAFRFNEVDQTWELNDGDDD